MELSLSASVSPDILNDWKARFDDIGSREFPRAVQYCLNGIAFDAVDRMRKTVPQVLESPKPWFTNGLKFQKADLDKAQSSGEVSSAMYVMEQQSVIWKFLMGQSPNVRLPGDAGPARERILVPNWYGIQLSQKIYQDRFGNVPPGFLKRLNTIIENQNRDPNRKQTLVGKKVRFPGPRTDRSIYNKVGLSVNTARTQQQVFKGVPKGTFGVEPGYYARPFRIRVPGYHVFKRSDGTEGRLPNMRNLGGLSTLFYGTDRARYDPVLQRPWDDVTFSEAESIDVRMVEEFTAKLARKAAGRRY